MCPVGSVVGGTLLAEGPSVAHANDLVSQHLEEVGLEVILPVKEVVCRACRHQVQRQLLPQASFMFVCRLHCALQHSPEIPEFYMPHLIKVALERYRSSLLLTEQQG